MFTKLGFCLATLTCLHSSQTFALLPDSLTTHSTDLTRHPRQFLRLKSPAEKSIIRYRPDPVENKWYLAVLFERGQGSLHTLPANMTTGFDYTTSISSQTFHYDGHVNLPFITS